MSLEAIELLSEAQRQAYADRLAVELLLPPLQRKVRHPFLVLFSDTPPRTTLEVFHGLSGYRLLKCRCEVCGAAWKRYLAGEPQLKRGEEEPKPQLAPIVSIQEALLEREAFIERARARAADAC